MVEQKLKMLISASLKIYRLTVEPYYSSRPTEKERILSESCGKDVFPWSVVPVTFWRRNWHAIVANAQTRAVVTPLPDFPG